MQKQLMHEVEAKRPAYVVFADVSDSWALRPGSLQVLALMPDSSTHFRRL
jgi:hypothetical protein